MLIVLISTLLSPWFMDKRKRKSEQGSMVPSTKRQKKSFKRLNLHYLEADDKKQDILNLLHEYKNIIRTKVAKVYNASAEYNFSLIDETLNETFIIQALMVIAKEFFMKRKKTILYLYPMLGFIITHPLDEDRSPTFFYPGSNSLMVDSRIKLSIYNYVTKIKDVAELMSKRDYMGEMLHTMSESSSDTEGFLTNMLVRINHY